MLEDHRGVTVGAGAHALGFLHPIAEIGIVLHLLGGAAFKVTEIHLPETITYPLFGVGEQDGRRHLGPL